MLRGATPRAEEMVGTAVLRIVVSSDSIKKATATSQGRSRLADAVGSDEKGLDEEGSGEDGGAIKGPGLFIFRKLQEASPPRTCQLMSLTHSFLCAIVPLAAKPRLGSSRV